jgi:amino acid adenylation domain-containing protein
VTVSRNELLRQMIAGDDPRAKYYPSSFSQQRLWFLAQFAPGSPFYNVEAEVPIHAALSTPLIESAINEICRRHEVLRTTFREVDGLVLQRVAPEQLLRIRELDLRSLPADERAARKDAIVTDEARRPFDLAAGPLLRVAMIRMDEEHYVFLLTMHHIIADGWSMGVFSRELSEIMTAASSGRTPRLPELPIQYGDFAAWQRKYLTGEVLDAQLAYWREQLGDAPMLQLPVDFVRPAVQTFRGAYAHFSFDPALTESLRALTRTEGVTLFMLLLAAFKTLLHRYSGQNDLVVGTYVANRNRAEIEPLIGFFLNTLVLRTQIEDDPPFRTFLHRVRDVCLGAYAHQDLPFEKIVESLNPGRDLSRNPLFQVTFQVQNAPTQNRQGSAASVEFKRGTAIFDLCFMVYETPRELMGHFEYSTDLFDAQTISILAEHFVQLLRSIVANPSTPLSRLDMLTQRDHASMGMMRGSELPPPRDSIAASFVARAAERGADPSLFTGDETVSFEELARRVHAIAAALRDRGLQPGEPVAVSVPRGPHLPAALLAVLHAGGMYVPLDPSYPAERLQFMRERAGARLLLTSDDIDSILERSADLPPPCAKIDPDAPAFLLFTSGSTGQPKGVALTHRQLMARLDWMSELQPFAPGEVGCQKMAASFIDSVAEILSPLLAGVPLLLLSEEESRDPFLLVRAWGRANVTRTWIIPSQLRSILDLYPDLGTRVPSLRLWVSTGEPLPPAVVRAFRTAAPAAALLNLYGTTEVWDAAWYDTAELSPNAQYVPVGKPVPYATLALLDARLQPVPTGATGELYVGGPGVAAGYWNEADASARRFVALPDGSRAFRTGDLARVNSRGVVEILGRADQQVKIRGHRVELEEIETILLQHEDVCEAAVIACEAPSGDRSLAAFIVPRSPSLTPAIVRCYLETRVPAYLVPNAFRFLDNLPKTPSGKIARRTLETATPSNATATPPHVSPETATEKRIAAIWNEVLGVRDVGIEEDFFAIGGHSLLATQVVSRVRMSMGIEVPLRVMFEQPTIRALAACVDTLGGATGRASAAAPIPVLPRSVYRSQNERRE